MGRPMQKRVLFTGVLLMLFLGLIYAWSLFAAPLEQAFLWSRSQTSVVFSVSMGTFCLGCVCSGILLRKNPPGRVLLTSAILFLAGFTLASNISTVRGLYLSYGVLCGFGVGLAYNAVLSTVPGHCPGRAGFATGALLMGMGLGSLVLGTVVNRVIESLGWAVTFRSLAALFFLIFLAGSLNLPGVTGQSKAPSDRGKVEYTLQEMLRTPVFWMVFLWAAMASSVGLGVVSNAAHMAGEAGIKGAALPLVSGVVSVGNGAGRLFFGAAFDRTTGERAMTVANLFFAVGILFAALAHKTGFSLCLALGFLLVGMAFGSAPTLSAAFVKKRYGEKHYPQNLSAVVLALLPASLAGPTIATKVHERFGHYLAVYIALLSVVLLTFLPVIVLRKSSRVSVEHDRVLP